MKIANLSNPIHHPVKVSSFEFIYTEMFYVKRLDFTGAVDCLVQPLDARYQRATEGQTDRQTDIDHSTVLGAAYAS